MRLSLRQGLGAGGEVGFQIGEQRFVIGTGGRVAVLAVEVDEFHRRVAGACQVDRKILARGGQVAGIGLDRAEHGAGGGGEAVDAGFQRAVICAQDRVLHACQQFFGIIDGAGDTVGLVCIDAFGALVAQGIGAEGHEVQKAACDGEAHGDEARLADGGGQGKARAGEDGGKDLARDGGAAGDAAVIIVLMRAVAFAGEPCGEQQKRGGAEAREERIWPAREGGEQQDERGEEEHVDARARALRAFAVKAVGRHGRGLAAPVFHWHCRGDRHRGCIFRHSVGPSHCTPLPAV